MASGALETVSVRRGVELVELRAFAPLGVDVVVTTRRGGVSRPPFDTLNLGDHVGDDPGAVSENRRRLADALGVAPAALRIARQVHGTAVAVVDLDVSAGEADVVATTDERVAIAILVADCVPLVLTDPVARVLVLAHAGWRGTAANAAGAAVAAAVGLGAVPARLRAAIGPCVAASRYQVGQDVAAALVAAGCEGAVAPDGAGRFLVDLAGANSHQLRRAGVPEAHVWVSAERTDSPRYFSDRAQRPCGRFALAARLAALPS